MLLLLLVAILVIGMAAWPYRKPRPAYRSLSDILAGYDDFDLVRGPDHQGPYTVLAAACAGRGEAVSGGFCDNGKTRDFRVPADPGKEFRVVGLAPEDGSGPTYIVLKVKNAATSSR